MGANRYLSRATKTKRDFRAKLTEFRKNSVKITPPAGTQIEDRLKEELFQYCVNGPRAKRKNTD